MSVPTVISLFSGIGGIDLAFTWAGFDVVAQGVYPIAVAIREMLESE